MVVLKSKALALVLLVGGLLLGSSSAFASVFYPSHYTLANGLQLVIVKNKLGPAVSHMVVYKVGAIDEVAGKTGIAHYLEHMMFKGTKQMPPGKFHEIIASVGGDENAYTSYDYTAYHETVARDHLALVMQMEADRMRGLRFDPDLARKEKSVVLSERQQRVDNSPNGLFREAYRAALFPDHPYGRPIIGYEKDIQGLSPQDLKSFYQKHYAPNRAIVLVSGNVDEKEVLRLAASIYGRVQPEKTSAETKLPVLRQPLEKELIHKDKRVTQPYSLRQYVVPSFAKDKKAAAALEVLAEYLSADVGPLHKHFVMDRRLASGVSVSYDGITRGPSLFSLATSPIMGACVYELEKDVQGFLRGMAKKGIAAKDVHKAKQRLLDGAIFARDRLMAPVEVLGGALAVGLPLRAIETWPDQIKAVQTKQVNQALQKLLVTPYQMVGFLTPETEVPQ